MLFLTCEVEGEERICLAMSGFVATKGEDIKMARKKKYNLEAQRGKIPTASTRATEWLERLPASSLNAGSIPGSEEFEVLSPSASKSSKQNRYKIKLKQLNRNFTCNFEVLVQAFICENVLPVSEGPWLEELKDLGVILTDTNVSSESIQVLIGADIICRLLTGKRKLLASGLVAVETHLGWTLMGKVPKVNTERINLAMTVTLFVKEAEIADLWILDVLGIKDPMEKESKQEIDLKTKEHFKETVEFNQDNRYEVCLPWADDSSPLPDNFNLAKKKLEVTTEKLLSSNLYDKYKNVFQEWLDEEPLNLDSHEDLNDFISKSTQFMLQGGFELRDWESTGCQTEHGWETPVLGMKWNRQFDSLWVNMSWMNELSLEKITNRIMLSAAHKVFDPIGNPPQLCFAQS
ncbi:hypothetical protein AVEN_216649-1 [Araneus ventricosus]|uniref:Peptidase aspartic putative domain-containing protein n=1 Tax=Araneus ventricosus TaxID=182803 RepID=A0A4Y2DWP8_ARAVE|nr:hypothetical protein AVEN_216649-1 [Araneus ventricosus]